MDVTQRIKKSDYRWRAIIPNRLRSQNLATRPTTISESKSDNTEADVQVEELRQKLKMAQEELENMQYEAEQVKKMAELTKEEGEEHLDKAQELMSALDQQTMRMQEMEQEMEGAGEWWAAEINTLKMKAELQRLRQLKEIRQQFDRECERHQKE